MAVPVQCLHILELIGLRAAIKRREQNKVQMSQFIIYHIQGSGTTDDSDSDNRNTAMFGSPGIWARIHTIFYR